jgi:SAM-dependent methyltransferase
MNHVNTFSFFQNHPETCAPDDFWSQVKRTVNGRPVSEDQIDMIVDAVTAGLDLQEDDILLDLCCGNGALSTRFFEKCHGGLGVDFSESLIQIAKSNFEQLPNRIYKLGDVVEYLHNETNPDVYTKILCYGSFAYLDSYQAKKFLQLCFNRYRRASILYIGNCPDKEKINQFFTDQTYIDGIENEANSAIGIWRTKKEFGEIAEAAGWIPLFYTMPEPFYASQYRYDVILMRS